MLLLSASAMLVSAAADDEAATDDDEFISHQEAMINAYVPKPFAFLSMICSFAMLHELIRDHRTKQGNAISRILMSVALADVLFSLALFLGTWPAPKETYQPIVGNVGNQGTCTAQGFVALLGFVASLLANVSLSVYYLHVVRHSWKDQDLQRIEWWVQGAVWLISLICAIYPIFLDLYNIDTEYCTLESDPPLCSGDDCIRGSNPEVHQGVFALLPVLCFFIIMGIMISLILRVRKIEGMSLKYSTVTAPSGDIVAPSGSNAFAISHQARVNRQKSQAVARQAIFYALAFMASYLLVMTWIIVYFAVGDVNNLVFDTFVWLIFLPSAGTFNFLVFARIRTMKTVEGRLLQKILLCMCCGREQPQDGKKKKKQTGVTIAASTVVDRSTKFTSSTVRQSQSHQPAHASGGVAVEQYKGDEDIEDFAEESEGGHEQFTVNQEYNNLEQGAQLGRPEEQKEETKEPIQEGMENRQSESATEAATTSVEESSGDALVEEDGGPRRQNVFEV